MQQSDQNLRTIMSTIHASKMCVCVCVCVFVYNGKQISEVGWVFFVVYCC